MDTAEGNIRIDMGSQDNSLYLEYKHLLLKGYDVDCGMVFGPLCCDRPDSKPDISKY